MENEEKKMNLFQKIQAVSNKIKGIDKDIMVTSATASYSAVSDKNVMLRINEAEKEFGIVSIPYRQELIGSEIIRSAPDKYGKVRLTYVDTIKMTVRIIDLDHPESFIEVESFGRGVDPSDKGFGKASTYARKYAMLNAYKIATGVDPDEKPSVPVEQEAQAETIRLKVMNYLLQNDSYREQVFGHFNIATLDDFTEGQINVIYNNLTKKNLL